MINRIIYFLMMLAMAVSAFGCSSTTLEKASLKEQLILKVDKSLLEPVGDLETFETKK